MKLWIVIASVTVGLALVIVLLWPHTPAVAPTTNTTNGNSSVLSSNTSTNTNTTVFSTADLPDRDAHFSFSLTMPSTWVAEYVASSTAINFFDPSVAGQTSLAKSQVFVQYYNADDWQPTTYSTQPADKSVGQVPARQYQYQVPAGVQFSLAPGYPAWVVTENHRLIHLRTGTEAPYTFFIFHQRPDLSDATFSDIVQSVAINS